VTDGIAKSRMVGDKEKCKQGGVRLSKANLRLLLWTRKETRCDSGGCLVIRRGYNLKIRKMKPMHVKGI